MPIVVVHVYILNMNVWMWTAADGGDYVILLVEDDDGKVIGITEKGRLGLQIYTERYLISAKKGSKLWKLVS